MYRDGAELIERDGLSAVDVPVLLLPWTTDPGHPASTSERLLELLPNAEMHLAEKLDDVGTWTDRVADFLARVVKRRGGGRGWRG